jgi:hypothetical protein
MSNASSRQMDFDGAHALWPAVPGASPQPVIVLITFLFKDDQRLTTRLDVQKEMFIDRVPETWSPGYARHVAHVISAQIRKEH